jgi:Predicted transcriptional regulators
MLWDKVGLMSMKIGELAARAKCQAVTVRYYEKEGLLARPVRSRSGYRLYTEADADRLMFIRHCRDHGMALAEIKALLALREAPDSDCSAAGELVDRHIQGLEQQIKSLERLKAQLIHLRKKCDHQGRAASCGILKGLTDRRLCGCLPADEN